jgi:uncharacterized protein with HEPN domain
MRRDPRTYLWDALRATELLAEFSSGKSFADYLTDAMLRSAVERWSDHAPVTVVYSD